MQHRLRGGTRLRLAALVLAVPGIASAGPGWSQPVPPIAVETRSVAVAGMDLIADLYLPVGRPAAGVAVVAHGWTRTRARHSDLGRALAEAGVIAVIPDLPNVMNLWGNGDTVVALVEQLEAGALGLAPVERERMVLAGTSAGGLATVLAASRLPGLGGWVGLDPVDRTGTGRRAAARMEVPAIVLLGEPSGCNLMGSGAAIAQSIPHLVRSNVFDGASHCDFESPTNNMCRVMCGGSSDAIQELIRHATVDATLELLAQPPH
jgi:dienelactone hydrolase